MESSQPYWEEAPSVSGIQKDLQILAMVPRVYAIREAARENVFRENPMRTRVVAVIALLSLPCALSAQLRRPSTRTPAEPASLPPTISEVARTLAYKRARWSFEGYTMMSAIQIPSASGPTVSYSTLGTGTHADYRITDRFAATADMSVSALGGPEMET